MYAYIKGKITHRDSQSVVVEAAGVGYHIFVSPRTLSLLPEGGAEAVVYTYFSVRDDAMLLYGFATREEKTMFEKLVAVSGVGPKLGLAVLAGMTVGELAIALVSQDVRALSRIPGVGKKTAERLILELRGAIGQDELLPAPNAASGGATHGSGNEAVEALMALGYSSVEASRAVAAAGEAHSVEQLILQALKKLDVR